MRAYVICITLAVVLTVATFGAVDWWQDNDPHPVAYVEGLWLDGLGGGK